jgi:hypothetical protein
MGNSLSLRNAEAAMPSLDEAATAARSLKAAMLGAVSGADMTEVMAGVVKRAKEGKASDIKLLMQMIAQSAPQVSIGIRANAAGQNGQSRAPRMLPAAKPDEDAEDAEEERLLRISGCVSACARAIEDAGPLDAQALSKRTPYSAQMIGSVVVDHEFFERSGSKWTLTEEGEAFVNAKGE